MIISKHSPFNPLPSRERRVKISSISTAKWFIIFLSMKRRENSVKSSEENARDYS
jgi:hypothetical protein